jgi:Mn-containing catalase
MPLIRDLLIDKLQTLYDAESQLTTALPKMSEAARNPRLKEAFDKHLAQTQNHVERLQYIFDALGATPAGKSARAMKGLIEEGEEVIGQAGGKADGAADLGLIAAAQCVEHYEISAYGTARSLARQMGERECERLLSQTLGDEESTDFLLTSIADPLVQQARLDDLGGDADLEGSTLPHRRRMYATMMEGQNRGTMSSPTSEAR